MLAGAAFVLAATACCTKPAPSTTDLSNQTSVLERWSDATPQFDGYHIEFSPDLTLVYAASMYDDLRVWQVEDGRPSGSRTELGGKLTATRAEPGGLLVATERGPVVELSPQLEPLRQSTAFEASAGVSSFSDSGAIVAHGMQWWDRNSGRVLVGPPERAHVPPAFAGEQYSLALAHRARLAALVDFETGRVHTHTLENPPLAGFFAGEGHARVVILAEGLQAKWYATPELTPQEGGWRQHLADVHRLAQAGSRGDRLAVAAGKQLVILDVKNGSKLWTHPLHDRAMDLQSIGDELAWCTQEGHCGVLNIDDGELLFARSPSQPKPPRLTAFRYVHKGHRRLFAMATLGQGIQILELK